MEINEQDSMVRAAFAYWEKRIAPVFDTARQIHIIDVESGRIVGETQEILQEDFPVQKTLRLLELSIEVLVCGAISRPLHVIVASYGIQVVPFVAGDLHAVIQAWLEGNLGHYAFAMPGCYGRGGRRFRGMHGTVWEAGIMDGRGRGRGTGGRRGHRGRGRGRMG
jgi:predicted Fe-Mo cluster-binding NifX family protein